MRVVSGIQPTGNLHLGNYLGAIKQWVAMQDAMPEGDDCLFFLADLHALSQPVIPAELNAHTTEMAATLLACGIDPKRAILFNQARVPAHSALHWILGGTARMGWLGRMTQWKDKAGKKGETQSVGLFTYPVLQAADVLLYQATHVPVGEDQKQHLELTRDIAQKFNHDFKIECFPIVEPLIFDTAARVMSLRDGTKKMSKSDTSDMSRINMTDDADAIAAKIRKAKTDPDALPDSVKGLAGRPEAENLMGIYAALADLTLDDVCARFGGGQFSVFKQELADLAVAVLDPIQARMRELLADQGQIDAVLRDGAERARALAAPILREVQDIVGFVRP